MAGVRLLWISAFLAAAAGCSKTVPSGGLVVVLRNDRTLQPEPDTLHVEVGPADGGAPSYKSANYSLADATTADKHAFPVSFAIESNGDPGASVSFIASVSNGSQPLETFDYVVDSIPTDYVVELDVVFRAACAAQASINGETVQASCCPAELLCNWTNGTCHCSAHRLPVYPADAGELGHGDGTDSGSMDMADSDSSDGAAVEDSGASGTGHDGSIDSSLGGGNDTGAAFDASACEIGAVRCSDYLTPQQCTPDGGWTSLTGCAQGSTYCLDGRCIATPTSCKSVTDYVGCDSYLVPGGTFLRGNDPLHDAGAAATISAFRLDAFEVPLWRFRQFVTAVIGGDSNVPSDLAEHGLHAHLPGGKGLNGGGDGGTYETGWDPSWNAMFPRVRSQWDFNLSCSYQATVWPPSGNPLASSNSSLPMNCVTWYEAYAFCIWDGGFLPTEAEWNYAAAGGGAQRLYPWGSTDPGTASQYAIYGCLYPQPTVCMQTNSGNIGVVGLLPLGIGPFGQYDLAGNVAEWTLDFYDSTYPAPCRDCAGLSPTGQRVFRGGGWDRDKQFLYTSTRVAADPAERFQDVGFRCARAP